MIMSEQPICRHATCQILQGFSSPVQEFWPYGVRHKQMLHQLTGGAQTLLSQDQLQSEELKGVTLKIYRQ